MTRTESIRHARQQLSGLYRSKEGWYYHRRTSLGWEASVPTSYHAAQAGRAACLLEYTQDALGLPRTPLTTGSWTEQVGGGR
jgi:hypothetical protein